jgi:hypothetical protein
VFDVAVAGTLLAACGLAKPQAAIEPNSRYTDIKNAVAATRRRVLLAKRSAQRRHDALPNSE